MRFGAPGADSVGAISATADVTRNDVAKVYPGVGSTVGFSRTIQNVAPGTMSAMLGGVASNPVQSKKSSPAAGSTRCAPCGCGSPQTGAAIGACC
ncbi:hypothetical protein IAE22_33290, partial [Bacillus sp. S34]|nr:hypothetical protein [Bacillus sp. S34]